ncbi:MAG TPA: hypothetical protein VLL51_06210 [Gemmatimonadales bacterium]|nr:hypothetical protein [Gemmatimonadales bacterium]
MIQPDARSRLTAADLQCLLHQTTGRVPDPEEVDIWLQDVSLDQVLDTPGLPDQLASIPVPGPSPSLFFYVMVRHALLARGLDDREVADYCAALIREFGLRDRAWRVAAVDDEQHRYLVDLLADLTRSSGERQFRVMVHLGNHALWLAGLFPERITARRERRGSPGLGYYDTLGYRGYAEASEHWLAARVGLAGVLSTAAAHFTTVRGALNDVSDRFRREAA